jgi:hypothetical protein
MFSFLKKDGEEESKGASKGDWITLVVLIGLAIGGYFYVKYAKQNYQDSYHEAKKIYDSGDYVKAKVQFEKVMDLGWRDSALEHSAYDHLDTLDSMENAQREAFLRASQSLRDKDSVTWKLEIIKLQDVFFLDSNEQKTVREWQSQTQAPQPISQ